MFEALLGRIARALADAGVPYMVIGGQAVLLYGEPRLTRDIDITLGIDANELPRLLRICASAGLRLLVPDPDAFVHETMVLPTIEPSTEIRVDFIFSSLLYERQAIERGHDRQLQGASVRYASVEDLIIHKLVAGRPRDIEDAQAIIAKTPAIDRAYVTRWLREFDQALSRELVSQFEHLFNTSRPS